MGSSMSLSPTVRAELRHDCADLCADSGLVRTPGNLGPILGQGPARDLWFCNFRALLVFSQLAESRQNPRVFTMRSAPCRKRNLPVRDFRKSAMRCAFGFE